MEVTYTASRTDHWRCNLYILAHKPLQIGLLLLPPVTLTCLVYSGFHHYPPQPLTVREAAFIALAIFGMFGVFYAGFMAATIDSIASRSSKSEAPGVSTTSLTPEGIRDLTPEQDQLLVWKDVRGIRLHNGDLYVNKPIGTIYVPRSAFKDRVEAQQFYQSALDLWKTHPASDAVSSTQRFRVASRRRGGITSAPSDETDGKLKDGETVIWQGSPSTSVGKNKLSFMTASLLGIGVLATAVMLMTTGLAAMNALILTWIGIIFLITLFSSASNSKATQVQYSLTDKRIRASVRKGVLSPDYAAIEFGQIEQVKYWPRPSGTATLEFSTAATSIDFDQITDAATVIALVAKARGQQPTDFEALFASRTNSDPFLGILHQGESLLWQGQPDRTAYIGEFRGFWGGIVFYPVLGALVFVAALVFSSIQPLWHQVAEMTPFVLIGAWLIARRYRARIKNASTLFYAVTNQRLLLFDQMKPQFFAEADLAILQKMKHETSASGIGTISFGGEYNNDIDFEFLRASDDVRRIITDAKQKISGTAMEWIDVTSERAKKPKPTLGYRLGCVFLIVILLWLPVELVMTVYYDSHYYEPGMRHYNRGEYAAAITDLRIATKGSMNEQAPYYLGLALLHEGRNQEARQAFERAADRAVSGRDKDMTMWNQAQTMIEQIDAKKTSISITPHR